MENKLKRCFMTLVAVFIGATTTEAFLGGEIINTSYAADDPLNSFINLDIEFDGTGSDVTMTGTTSADTGSALNALIKFIKWIALGGSLVLLGVFVLNIIKMGTAGTNVQARTAAQQGLIWSGLSAAILTISTTIFFFMQGALK